MKKEDTLKIPRGNDFTLLVELTRKLSSFSASVAESIAETATEVTLLTSQGGRLSVPKTSAGMEAHDLQWALADVDSGKAIAITVPCDVQRVDCYGLEVVGQYADGGHWRYKAKAGEAFSIVDATSDQNVPESQVRIFTLSAVVGMGASSGGGGGEFTQMQSDWDQTDDTAVDFIKNKPTLFDGDYDSLRNKPTLFDGDYESLRNKPTIPDVSNKEDKVSIHEEETGITALSAVVDTYHVVPDTVSNLAVTLPTMTEAQKIQGVFIYLKTGSGTPDVTFNSSHDVVLPKGYTIEANTIYEFNCIFNSLAWVVAYAAFEEQT